MAFATGTATDWNDALVKLRAFLTTNVDLVAAGQQWQELRWVPDNLEAIDSNMPFTAGTQLQTICRPDARTQNYSSETNYQTSSGTASGQYIRMKLRTAKAVTSMTFKTGSSSPSGESPSGFRLEYSDDGTNWTVALTVTGQTGWAGNEERTFAVPGSTGAHLWWRYVFVSGGSTTQRIRSIWLYNGAELVNSSECNLAVKGTGLAGADEIFLFFRTFYRTDTGDYAVLVNAGTGYLTTDRSLNYQPGLNPDGFMVIPTWPNAMPYWFAANGRRVVFVFKVSTNFESGYAGLFLPFATPAQYALPLCIGGSMAPNSTSYRYDRVAPEHSVFCMPGMTSSTSSGVTFINYSTLKVMLPDGSWFGMGNRPSSSGTSESYLGWGNTPGSVYPHDSYGYGFRENIGGGYSILPAQLFQRQTAGRWLGQLDGVAIISGFGNGAENTGTIGTDDYVVFSNCYRSDIREYWALKAE